MMMKSRRRPRSARDQSLTGRPKTAILCVNEKNQTAYLRMTARPGFFRFLASHHFFSGLRILNSSTIC
jgi:hypothetical protein